MSWCCTGTMGFFMRQPKCILKLFQDAGRYIRVFLQKFLGILPALSLFFTGGSITVIELDDAGVIDSE